jgi:hypothetical protein
MYSLDIYDIITSILPRFLRKTRQIAWHLALLKPLEKLNWKLDLSISNIRYRLNLNGQIIYLEHYLNDLYDPLNRGIYISDGAPIFEPTLFNKDEKALNIQVRNKSEPQQTVYLFNRSEYNTQYDFIVNVPNQINLTTQLSNQIKASVNRYRIAGTRFKVQS